MWVQVQQALSQSMIRVLSQLASLLPGILALIVALVVSAVMAWLVAAILRRSLAGIQFDQRLPRWGFPSLSEWSPEKSPTLLVSRIVGWSIVLTGFLIGISAFDLTLTSELVLRF